MLICKSSIRGVVVHHLRVSRLKPLHVTGVSRLHRDYSRLKLLRQGRKDRKIGKSVKPHIHGVVSTTSSSAITVAAAHRGICSADDHAFISVRQEKRRAWREDDDFDHE